MRTSLTLAGPWPMSVVEVGGENNNSSIFMDKIKE
jgi:hypothetical protein